MFQSDSKYVDYRTIPFHVIVLEGQSNDGSSTLITLQISRVHLKGPNPSQFGPLSQRFAHDRTYKYAHLPPKIIKLCFPFSDPSW